MKSRIYLSAFAILLVSVVLGQGFTVMPQVAQLNVTRYGHGAVNLPDGRILVVGGHTSGFALTITAEIYNPANDTWTLHNLNNPHDGLAMTRLSDGRFMFLGGCSSGSGVGQSVVTTIYNPILNTFSDGPQMTVARTNSTAATLANGDVLVFGNWYSTGNAELYKASINQFVAIGNPVTERSMPLILPCTDGSAYVLGGYGIYGGSAYTSIEKYDPQTNTFSLVSAELISGETGWVTSWASTSSLIDKMRLSNGDYVFMIWKTVGNVNSYRLTRFNPNTKAINIIPTTPQIPDYDNGTSSEFAFYSSIMVDPFNDYVYLNAINAVSGNHEDRLYSIDVQDGLLYIPAGQQAFTFYLGSGSKVWLNGNIMYTGGTIDGSNFNVSGSVTVLSPENVFKVTEEAKLDDKFYLYPNPAEESFMLTLPFSECRALRIFDINGNLMREMPLNNLSDSIQIEREGLAPGIYFVEVDHRFGTNATKITLK